MSAEFPLHSPEFYAGDPYPAYRALRASSPVHWNDETRFWALLKYDDIRFVSSHPELFTSTKGITIPDPDHTNAVQEGNLIFTDPPRHRRLRKLISSGFTPRQVTILDPKIRSIVDGILDRIEPGSTHEFAEEIAAPLPTRLIAELIGAPAEDWEQFRTWSDAAVGLADPEIELDPFVAMGELFDYFRMLIAARRSEQREDLLSILVGAEVDGEHLSDEDLLNFSFLLLVAGNETTRNLIALGTLALIDHPDEHRKLLDDASLVPSAVEEMLRWNSPVTHMARTATCDVELRGTKIGEGDTVVMLYGSANRDEEVFGDDAEEFKIAPRPESTRRVRVRRAPLSRSVAGPPRGAHHVRGAAAAISRAHARRRRRPDAGHDGSRGEADAGAARGGELTRWTTTPRPSSASASTV